MSESGSWYLRSHLPMREIYIEAFAHGHWLVVFSSLSSVALSTEVHQFDPVNCPVSSLSHYQTPAKIMEARRTEKRCRGGRIGDIEDTLFSGGLDGPQNFHHLFTDSVHSAGWSMFSDLIGDETTILCGEIALSADPRGHLGCLLLPFEEMEDRRSRNLLLLGALPLVSARCVRCLLKRECF